ncbi:hypothetical protein [Bacillus cereus group sp. MYBK139-2]|uniref:hypothetical protein n=1 Tax=unclassified Bacillus cereus group TaxID=2750818 RepID=UPI003F79566A
MFGLFKKKGKKVSCTHKWHHLQDTYVGNDTHHVDDACYIFCSKCEKQTLVLEEEWERIKKKQEIIDELNPKHKYVIKLIHSRNSLWERLVVIKGNRINETRADTVVIDGVEITFGLHEFIQGITTYKL